MVPMLSLPSVWYCVPAGMLFCGYKEAGECCVASSVEIVLVQVLNVELLALVTCPVFLLTDATPHPYPSCRETWRRNPRKPAKV